MVAVIPPQKPPQTRQWAMILLGLLLLAGVVMVISQSNL